jgi:pimeloyl-ACP methyl ester carboxylesterase
MIVTCEECGHRHKVGDDLEGRKIRCRGCGAAVMVTVPDDEVEEIPPLSRSALKKSGGSKHRKASSDSGALSTPLKWGLGIVGLAVVIVAAVVSLRPGAGQPGAGPPPVQIPIASTPLPPVTPAVAQPTFNTGEWNARGMPLRNFPEFGPPVEKLGTTVTLHSVDFGSIAQTPDSPAAKMKLRIYMPAGELPPGSIPLVLIAPAGTPLVVGNEIDAGNYHAEALPYAEAGMCAIHYSLDGAMLSEEPTNFEFAGAHRMFAQAEGGMINARNALEFALARIPAVDPKRVYTAGHSSAATISLLFASLEPRVAACIAYAPCTDTVAFCRQILQEPAIRILAPQMSQFAQLASPLAHVDKLKCPVFLFYTPDDSTTPMNENQPYITRLQQNNTAVKLEIGGPGGHYQPMVDQGIPRAIQWLQETKPVLASTGQ